MSATYSLIMQKSAVGSAVKSSLEDFGFAVKKIPWPEEETEEVASRVWPGEAGEDAYVSPDGLRLRAYDLEVTFLYSGDTGTAYARYKALRGWLTGAGGMMKVYDPYWMRGRQGVYVKKIGDAEPFRTNADEGVSVKVTFRVTDPETEIAAGTDAGGAIISLGAV